MAVADKFIMSDETAKGLVNGIKVGGFWGRIAVYVMLYIPMFGVAFLITISMTKEMINFFGCTPQNVLPIFFVMAVLPALLFILIEWRVRSWRRKNGFSVYKNIVEELKQREVDVYVAREEKARGKIDNSSGTKDLEYWFGLFEKGAITKEEYEKKKMELL